MQPPEVPSNEPRRLAALQSLDVLFTPAEERFDRITRLASRSLEAPIVLVSLVADKCQWFKSAHGLDMTETPREASFCGHAILGEETFVVENALQDERFADNPLVTGEPGIRFYAAHPLHAEDGSRVGAFCIIDRRPRKLEAEQAAALRDFAAIAEAELQRTQMSFTQRVLMRERDELQRKAMIDGLTRVWTRSAIMELLGGEVARARRGSPTCVAMIDADHFKAINDSHGHQAGDAVLVEIAARTRRAVREFDAVGRYGGEEFIGVFSNCGLDAAAEVAERIRSHVASLPIPTPAGELAATVSVGLAAFDPAHTDADSLVGAADAALYRAKAHGRNRVEY
jgi:diguanylate cyclase (GGDEF)-like protein